MATILEIRRMIESWRPINHTSEDAYRRSLARYARRYVRDNLVTAVVDSNYNPGDPVDIEPRSSSSTSIRMKVLLDFNHQCYADVLVGDRPIELKLGPRNSGELQRLIGQIILYRMSERNDVVVLLCDYNAIAAKKGAKYSRKRSREDMLRRRQAYIQSISRALSCSISDVDFNGFPLNSGPDIGGDIPTGFCRVENGWIPLQDLHKRNSE